MLGLQYQQNRSSANTQPVSNQETSTDTQDSRAGCKRVRKAEEREPRRTSGVREGTDGRKQSGQRQPRSERPGTPEPVSQAGTWGHKLKGQEVKGQLRRVRGPVAPCRASKKETKGEVTE